MPKIVWLTDIHMTLPGEAVNGRDPAAALTRCIDHILRHHADADLAAVTGDLADTGAAEEYARVRVELDRLPMPVAITLGNHDRTEGHRAVFGEAEGAALGHTSLSVNLGERWRCLLLDTNGTDASQGDLAIDRLDWLAAELDAARHRRYLLLLHHPPARVGLPGFDAIGLRESARLGLAAVLGRHRERIALIGFGHCHMPIAGAVAGIPMVGMGSVLYRVRPDFEGNGFDPVPWDPGVYGVILLGPAGPVVHTVATG